jgi:hypothetical protein
MNRRIQVRSTGHEDTKSILCSSNGILPLRLARVSAALCRLFDPRKIRWVTQQ